MNRALLDGLARRIGDGVFTARLNPGDDRCCVVLDIARRGCPAPRRHVTPPDEPCRPRDQLPGDEDGDPVCWLDRVCPDCGLFTGANPPPRCPRCGGALDENTVH